MLIFSVNIYCVTYQNKTEILFEEQS